MSLPGRAIAVATTAYLALVAFLACVSRPLDHDEHQFMASAFLIVHGRHPYRDYPYFHMPNQSYLFAPAFFTASPLLTMRLLAGACGFAVAAVIFLAARRLQQDASPWHSSIIAAAAATLLVHSPLFTEATAHIWNHTTSVLCALLACTCHATAIRHSRSPGYFLLSGLSLGMAIGIRLSFLPLILPFLLAAAFFPVEALPRRARGIAVFTGGVLAMNAPALFFLATNFSDFVFGNFGYAMLNETYRATAGFEGPEFSLAHTMTLAGKLHYFFADVVSQASNFAILGSSVACLALLGLAWRQGVARPNRDVQFLLFCVPFVFVGALAPTPSWYQYYFAPLPFLLLLTVHTHANLRGTTYRQAATAILLLAALFSMIASTPLKSRAAMSRLGNPASWEPIRVRRYAQDIATLVAAHAPARPGGSAEILTLSPIYAIESGLPIDASFATGPFAWRVASLLSDDERVRARLPDPGRIGSLLDTRPPRAILTGKESARLEEPIVRAATARGYRSVSTPAGLVVWFAP